ncbi:RBBP9/YdeN family alpha/beta hydrolase [Sphingomonas sp. PR090111-T3T-6A]|uniref:RBBP9/YdeN family alpha/beta hydrolase n=1 Tax=Sphingomonas sp. PR090111-T3T-6A TaxID=685778 RepID=UPI0003752C5A|nr:alpha/beta hydrolase [Sphingomonas sp. PR090111-T3T-6A]
MVATACHTPICLAVPDLGGVTPRHWLALWQRRYDHFHRIDMGAWDAPLRNSALSHIDENVRRASAPVILVAHGLGALAVAWWAALLGKRAARRIQGALLVGPVDAERADAEESVRRFGPIPTAMLPFPSIVVASENDPYVDLDRAREIAGEWTSDFVNAGSVGHFGTDAKLGHWPLGERMLDILISGGPGLSRYTYRPEPPIRANPRRRTAKNQGLHRVGL